MKKIGNHYKDNPTSRILKLELTAFLIFTIVYAIGMGIFLYYINEKLPKRIYIFGTVGMYPRDAAIILSYGFWTIISAFVYLRFKYRFEQ